MTHVVRLSPLAIADLVALHRWITAETDATTADGYIDRIEARTAALASLPHRDAPRDDIGQGMRTLSFERRLLIVYRAGDALVDVVRVIDARRELGLASG